MKESLYPKVPETCKDSKHRTYLDEDFDNPYVGPEEARRYYVRLEAATTLDFPKPLVVLVGADLGLKITDMVPASRGTFTCAGDEEKHSCLLRGYREEAPGRV